MKRKTLLQYLVVKKSHLKECLRIMRVSFILLFVCVFHMVATNSEAQNIKIELSSSNLTVRQLLNEIEKQTDYLILFRNSDVDTERLVRIKSKKDKVTSHLDAAFKDTDIRYEFQNKYILLSSKDAAPLHMPQQEKRTITGTVTDERGEPIIGANIMEKGTTNGAITDIDGNFSLPVSAGSSLTVSYIGFKNKEIAVGNQFHVSIMLIEDTQSLDEIVVVGYGTQKKVTLTGSIASVKGDEVVKSPATNVVNALTGRMPGVIINARSGEPGNDNPEMFIRGRGTTGNTDVLVIIDGVERDGFGQLNPNDIESVTVLKDASAAIYGARAANGVVLVTTKRGTNAKPRINLSYNQGFTQPTRKQSLADSYEYGLMYNEVEVGEGRPAKYSTAELQKFRDGSDPNYANTDWYDVVMRKLTPQHRTNLSVAGGAERVKYYISFGEVTQSGHFKGGTTKARQYNLRSNIDVQITDWLQVGMNVAGRYDKNHYPIWDNWNLYSHIYLDQPDWPVYWPGTDYLFPGRGSESLLNRVNDNGGYRDIENKVFQGSLFFKLDVPHVKGLSIEGNGSYDTYHTFEKTFEKPTWIYLQDGTTGEYVKTRSGYGADLASLKNEMKMKSVFYLNAKVNYERQFGVHNLGVMVGYEQQELNKREFWAERGGFLSMELPELFAGSSDKTLHNNSGKAEQGARQNIYGRATYDYAGKYMAQFTFRRDGSPNFPKSKRFGFFPSISAGWRISEEVFMQRFEELNNLKIRGSWGKMGNDIVDAFQYLTAFGYDNAYVIGNKDVSGLVQSGVPNPIITWETAKTWNLGVEALFWNGLLGVEFDYFQSRRSDILMKRSASIPSYTGLDLPDENIGIVDNKGFEMVLTHANTKNKLRYNISGNFSFARNKVVFSDEQPAAEPYQLETGSPMKTELYYKSIGIFKDQAEIDSYPHLLGTRPGDIKYEDVNRDGVIDSRDMIRVKQTNTPEIVYGLTTSFSYQSFDLSILFQGQANSKVYFGGYFPIMSPSLGNFSTYRAENRWTPENTIATMPRASAESGNNNSLQSTHWLFDTGFLRVKNVEIGYNLPKNICSKVYLEDLRISLSAHNLFFIYDKMKGTGYDPEAPEYWYYPQQRTYNIGVNLTF